MRFSRAAAWSDDERPAQNKAQDEAVVRGGFWRKLGAVAAHIPFAEDLLIAYYCAFDRHTPNSVRVALLGALAYFVMPFDAIPDMLPVLGLTDDAAVLAAALKLVWSSITPAHRAAAHDALVAHQDFLLEHDLIRNRFLRISFPITLRSAISFSACVACASG